MMLWEPYKESSFGKQRKQMAYKNQTVSSYLVPRFQNQPVCKTFHMKMSSIYMKINLWREHIFTWIVSHKYLIWHRGKRQLKMAYCLLKIQSVLAKWRFKTLQVKVPWTVVTFGHLACSSSTHTTIITSSGLKWHQTNTVWPSRQNPTGKH